jgi:hypothetical protein
MRTIRRFICGLVLIPVSAGIALGQGWRGIVPLHSTRADVERLIGAPTESNGITYDLKTERVSIYYSSSACVKGWPHGWNVPPGVVINIVVFPQVKLTLAQLGINVTGFAKSTNARIGITDYTNEHDGVSIGVRANGDVEVIQYQPSAKDKGLLCPDALAREREIKTGAASNLAPLLYYFDVTPKEEAVRLEFFADQLKKYPPESMVYIIGYGGRDACANEGINRANRARAYLLQRPQQVAGRRIITVDGGRNSSVWVELYIVPTGGPRPLSTPDIHPELAKNKNCLSTAKGNRLLKRSLRR